jgi:phage recombination protein Bet
MTSTALQVVREPSAAVAEARQFAEYIEEKRALIRRNLAPKATDVEFDLFIEECKFRILNPFAKQIYLIPYGQKHTTVVSIHGARLIASRTGEYAGSDPYEYDTEDAEQPGKATCTVWRLVQGVRCAFTSTVRWKERVNKRNFSGSSWESQPFHMLGKCAEMDALRKAFPEECGGLYTDDEMAGQEAGIAEPPLRASGALPSGLKEDQFARLEIEASQRGVHLTRGMTLDQMAAQIAARGGPQIPGVVKAGDVWGALKRVPQPVEAAPARPVRQPTRGAEAPAAPQEDEPPIAGEAREEEPEMSEADRALYAATDTGQTLPLIKD